MNIPSYPKIFTIGQRYTSDLFNHTVEITEKIDGAGFPEFYKEYLLEQLNKDSVVQTD